MTCSGCIAQFRTVKTAFLSVPMNQAVSSNVLARLLTGIHSKLISPMAVASTQPAESM